MRHALAIGIGVLTLAALPALGADLPPRIPTKAPVVYTPTAYSWTGCYVGGYVGGAWSNGNTTSTDTNGYNGPDTWAYKLGSSVIGGGTLGCNYQTGQFVFGLEGEGGYMHLTGSALDPLSPFLPLDTTASARIGDWYGMVTARAGIAWDRALLYVKGGVAFVDVRTSVVDPILQPVVGNTITATSPDTVRAAWTVGGGLEYALSDAWSIKGEYMYIGLKDNETACGNASVGGGRFCWNEALPGIHTAKFGINYHFNAAPLVARY